MRITLIAALVVIAGVLLSGRLLLINVSAGEELRAQARHQYVAPAADSFNRGTIFFKGKDGTRFRAATLKTGYLVALHPERIADPEAVYDNLSAILPDLDREATLAKARKKNDPYEELARRLDSKTADKIRALDMPGVRVYEHQWRYYPRETLAAHILGFVGYDNETLKGRYGAERYYDDVLSRDQSAVSINFFAELFANLEHAVFSPNDQKEAGDVVLTIEPDIQRITEEELKTLRQKWNTGTVGAIVMRPDTGAITALAARPAFNPNQFGTVGDYSVFANPLIESVYELGSIMKPLTMAIGIDSGAITPKSTYFDAGVIEVNGVKIANYDGRGRGRVPMQEVLNQSLNTGAVHIMQKTGPETFAGYFKNLELGEETGIDLPSETRGLVSNVLEGNNAVDYAAASFGQGFAPTPIGMARALGVLANGGVLPMPHITDTLRYQFTEYEPFGGIEGKRVFAASTTEMVTRMLVEVVDTTLAGGDVALPHHSIAAKTGTAQIALPDGSGYYQDRYLHSFFGYFPAYDPEFLIFLYAKEPDARYAAQTLTEPFMDIAKYLINYYEIPPDR